MVAFSQPVNRSNAAIAVPSSGDYVVVDTGQTKCYDNRGEIAPPKLGQSFYGQDAQFQAHPASYTLSADGLTVRDNVTGLTWQRSPDTDGDGTLTRRDKLTLAQAQALPSTLNAARFGGFNDWRLPSIKELYSLFDGRGTDPSGPMDLAPSSLVPYIDTRFFKFAYGDTRAGERIIDSQYASSTKYVGKSARGEGSYSASISPTAGSKATTADAGRGYGEDVLCPLRARQPCLWEE